MTRALCRECAAIGARSEPRHSRDQQSGSAIPMRSGTVASPCGWMTAKTKLEQIPGTVPTLRGAEKPGCRFAPRCALAKPMHFENTPPLKEVRPGHKVACFLY